MMEEITSEYIKSERKLLQVPKAVHKMIELKTNYNFTELHQLMGIGL